MPDFSGLGVERSADDVEHREHQTDQKRNDAEIAVADDAQHGSGNAEHRDDDAPSDAGLGLFGLLGNL